jgi:two-component system, sensor histidine kinase and response regulator
MARQQLKNKLQANDQLFRSIFDNAQIGISFFSIDGREAFSNRACHEMLGCTEEELSRVENWDRLVHPDDRATGAKRYSDLQQGKCERDEWEQRYIRRDGREVVTNARFALLRNARGQPQYVTSLTEDITERKRVEEERNRVAQRMQLILESTGQGIYGIDLQGNCTFINRATCEMIGYSPEEILGRNMHELVHHHKSDGSIYSLDDCPIYRAFKNGKGCRVDQEVMWQRVGTPIPVEYSSFPILEHGRITGAVVTVSDITERKRAEEAVKENERLFRSIFENAPVGISLYKLDGAQYFTNRALQEMVGYTHEELSSLDKWSQIVHPDERASRAERYTELLSGERNNNEEWEQRLLHRDGRIVITHRNCSVVRGPTGRPEYLLNMAADITERKWEQEERNRVAKQMEMLLESTGQGIYGIDLQGNCTFINRATSELIGYLPEEALGRNMHDLAHHHRPDGSVYPADQCPVYRALKKGEGCSLAEEVMWRRDGTPIPVEYSSFPILEDGRITGAVVTVVDITERKRGEARLRESEQLFRSIFENAQIGISFYNIETRTIFPNRALQEMLGYNEDELGQLSNWDEISHPEERAFCAQQYLDLVQGKCEKNEWEQRLVRKDGRIATTSVRFSLLRDAAGRPRYVAALQEDITERKRLEKELVAAKEVAEAATQAKSDFLANMSHEIRTPMNAILGMTHLALKTDVTPKQRDYLTKTKAAAQSLLGIINDLLDFSKIEAGKLDMEKTDFRLEGVLESISTVVGQKAHDKDLEFLISAPRDLPPYIVGDPLRLGQILINLVSNAVKFTEQGEITVTVSLAETVWDKVLLKFSVRDSGIGMTLEQSGRLFQPFSQADSSTTRKYGGTGLGLSISKRLVEMMDGNIWVESNYGRGSTFHFTAWFGIGRGETKHVRLIPDIRGIRALVVDDNQPAREILADSLKGFALRVESVSSGEDAIRALIASDSQDPYQLVMMDWHMPGVDGLEASRIIKRGNRLKHVPKIVMVTTFGREDIGPQTEELGIEGYLLKPITPSTLYDTLVGLFDVTGDEADPARIIRADTTSQDASGVRILLVEDNEVNQQVATELLESVGATVRIANHGGEALRILTEGNEPPPFDIVFMDLQMPEMDGFTATRLLRADPKLHGLPIIAMTAHALVEERERCLEAGMNDHVSKPIDPDALFATLMRWAKRSVGTAAKHEERSAKSGGDVILPEIEGVDEIGGLRRVAGNKRLYRDLLVQFAAKQGSASSEISAAIESGDSELAERIAHTVKGVAGNLGLQQVLHSAEAVERAIREGDAQVSARVKEFAQVLSRQVEVIQQARSALTPDCPGEANGSTGFDVQGATAAVAHLRALLESNDGGAGDAFLALENALPGTVDRSLLQGLGASISEFDFERALLKLAEIAREYGTKWEPTT